MEIPYMFTYLLITINEFRQTITTEDDLLSLIEKHRNKSGFIKAKQLDGSDVWIGVTFLQNCMIVPQEQKTKTLMEMPFKTYNVNG